MEVEATQRGFYLKLREEGDRFDCPEERFSEEWMKRVEVKKKITKKKRGRPRKSLSE